MIHHQQNRSFVLFSFLIALFIFLPDLVLYINVKHLITMLIFIGIFFLLGIAQKHLFVLVGMAVILLTVVFSHIYIHWGVNGLSSRLQAAMLSPPYESIEYLKTYLDWRDMVLMLYMLTGFVLLYKYLSVKNNIHHKRWLGVLALILFGSFFMVKNPLTKILPFSIPNMYYEAGDWVDNAKARISFMQKKVYPTDFNQSFRGFYHNIVVVVGESASKHHMSVYGYKHKTTPFLNNLSLKKFSFVANAIAPANQTRFAIPMELTNAKADSFKNFFSSFSLVSYLKAVNYQTYWISNQAKVGKYDTYVTTIANEADKTDIVNQNFGSSKPDGILLTHLPDSHISSEREAIFIHLMGSHFQYKDRYDSQHILFKHPKNIVEEYDNSIYYTDYILSKIFTFLKKQKAPFLFVYFSDHAELVSEKKHGHGFLPPIQEAYDIPLIVYSSIENERIGKLKEYTRGKTINAESLKDLILYINHQSNDLTHISFRKTVVAADPKNIFEYDSIKKFAIKRKILPPKEKR